MKDSVIKLFDLGRSQRQIAKELLTSQTTVGRILRKLGKTRSIRTDNKIEQQILEQYNFGISAEKLAKIFDLNASTICRIIRRLNGKFRSPQETQRKYKLDKKWLDDINSEEKSYFLGFMMADGNVRKNLQSFKIVLHNQDEDVLHKFGKLMFDGKYPLYKNSKYYSFFVHSPEIAGKLNELGVIPNKTFTGKFPNYLREDMVRHYLRGLFDGDGCIYKRKNNNCYLIDFTGNKHICDAIKQILKDNGINRIITYKRHPTRDNNIISIRINSQYNVMKFLNFLYKDSKINLDRKYHKYYTFLKGCKYVKYEHIINEYKLGNTPTSIANKLDMNDSTVWRIIDRYKSGKL